MKSMAVLFGLLLVPGCDATRDTESLFGPAESGGLVVDALLIVDRPMPALFVRETVGAGEVYTRDRAGVTDAEVIVSGGVNDFVYRSDASEPGRYVPPAGAPMVLPETTYALTVRSQGREARATTITPSRLSMREAVLVDDQTLREIRKLKTFRDGTNAVFEAPENRVVYQEGRLDARFDALDVPGYQISIESLDLDSEVVVDSDLLSEEDYADLERWGVSPAFEARDGTIPMPWFAVYYAGRHIVRIYAIDHNWFDLIRSVPEFFQDEEGLAFQPGGLAGDNFERPIFRVEGGIGLFGSASVDSLGFVLLPKPGN